MNDAAIGIDPLGEDVEALGKPMRLPLENSEAGQDDVAIIRVPDGTGIIQIQEMHSEGGGRAR